MLVQVFTFLLIILHAFGPCCCAPIGFIENSDEVRRGLTDSWTLSSDDRKMTVVLLKRLVKNQNGKVGKNEHEEIIQIPDDMVVTCKGCQPTEEVCSSTIPSTTDKHSATTIQYSSTSPTAGESAEHEIPTARETPPRQSSRCDCERAMREKPRPRQSVRQSAISAEPAPARATVEPRTTGPRCTAAESHRPTVKSACTCTCLVNLVVVAAAAGKNRRFGHRKSGFRRTSVTIQRSLLLQHVSRNQAPTGSSSNNNVHLRTTVAYVQE